MILYEIAPALAPGDNSCRKNNGVADVLVIKAPVEMPLAVLEVISAPVKSILFQVPFVLSVIELLVALLDDQ